MEAGALVLHSLHLPTLPPRWPSSKPCFISFCQGSGHSSGSFQLSGSQAQVFWGYCHIATPNPNVQKRMLNSCSRVFSWPRSTFQLSVTDGATHLTVRGARLCHQKAAASWHSLSNGAQGQDRKAPASWSCLAVWHRSSLAKPRQGFHGSILHEDKPSILQGPPPAGLPA